VIVVSRTYKTETVIPVRRPKGCCIVVGVVVLVSAAVGRKSERAEKGPEGVVE